MPICSIKFWEMDEAMHKYKGRICFRGDAVKDQDGQHAIFQELSASPTSVHTTNSNIAYGALSGHKSTVADAIRAYVQSLLKSAHTTWVGLPKTLWPEQWHQWGMRRPMCVLKKALYGHPDSGGHWERHLNSAIEEMGGEAIPNHPSSYWFEGSKLFLTVYVDDLLLSGPEEKHEEFWNTLRKRIDLGEGEALDRFLGRTRRFI